MRSTRSEEDLMKAKKCAEILYGKQDMLSKELLADVLDELPMTELTKEKQWGICDIMVSVGLAESKSRN